MKFLNSNFRRVLKVVFFLLGYSPASEFYIPTFRNTLFHLPSRCPAYTAYEDGRERVFRNYDIKFRRRGITQRKKYNNKVLLQQ
jgi:hypothetical protein